MRFSSTATKTASRVTFGLTLVLSGAFVLATLSSCGGSNSARNTPSSQTFRDPSGDAISSNMRLDRKLKSDILKWVDLQTVKVSSDSDRMITFAIGIPNTRRFGPDIAVPGPDSFLGALDVTVYVRSQKAAAKHAASVSVISYAIGIDAKKQGNMRLARWTGTGYRTVPAPDSLSANSKNGVATLTVSAADLGITTGFDFAVTTSIGSGVLRGDKAPDKGWWRYKLHS
jgi:hypothetical protein